MYRGLVRIFHILVQLAVLARASHREAGAWKDPRAITHTDSARETPRKESTRNMFAAPTCQFVFVATLLLQIVGIASVCFARAADNTTTQRRWQILFFVCFASLGVAVIWAFRISSGCWIACSTTLALMTVGATFDTRSTNASATF